MPEELSWLPLIESGFQTNALSSARALGLWQFIASTGYKFGLERNEWVDNRMDPQQSTRAAIAYLKELHGIFGTGRPPSRPTTAGGHRAQDYQVAEDRIS